MSFFTCICGHVIRDGTDQLPFKAQFLRDFDEPAVYDAIAGECDALIAAISDGDRESWLRRHFLECYPRHLSNGEAFHDFLFSLMQSHVGTMYECEACGRLWVEQGNENVFVPYKPESGEVRRVLRSPRDNRSV